MKHFPAIKEIYLEEREQTTKLLEIAYEYVESLEKQLSMFKELIEQKERKVIQLDKHAFEKGWSRK